MRKIIIIFCLFGIISAIACAHKTQDMLNSRLGKMTYEEALQRFGPPTQCAEAGSTKVCKWVYGPGGTVIMPVGEMLMAIPTHAPTAQLTFISGVLTYWKLTGKWE